MNRRSLQLCAWSAPALIVFMGVGVVGFARLVPPPSPSDSAEAIQRMFIDNQTGIRIGMVLAMIASAGFIPWICGLAHQLKDTGHDSPVLTHIQTGSGVVAFVVGTNFALITSLAAFRPAELPPETTRLLDDLMWFWWLIPWPAFSVECILVGVLILRDKNTDAPVFPRWSGYLTIWAAICYSPGSLAIFFKSGPFAYDSLITWYIPTVVFFIWMLVMTPLMLTAANRIDRPENRDTAAGYPATTSGRAGSGSAG